MFAEWNSAELDSYLIEITRDILGFVDKNGEATVDKILDAAGQKGTGKWTVIEALDEGVPLTLIGEAVFARALSAAKEERVNASKQLKPVVSEFKGDRKQLIDDLRQALYASKIISYAQGYQLMRAAAKTQQWNLNYGGIALVWRAGCIIRSAFLGDIKKAFERDPQLVNLLLDPFFREAVSTRQAGWRRAIVARGSERHPGAVHERRFVVFRRLSRGAAAGEPVASSAGFLRRAHLRAHRSTARPVLPHGLDWPRRRYNIPFI